MRFNNVAYDKIFPRVTEEHIETSVEKFTPTTDKLNGDVDGDGDVSVSTSDTVVVGEEELTDGCCDDGTGNDN